MFPLFHCYSTVNNFYLDLIPFVLTGLDGGKFCLVRLTGGAPETPKWLLADG